MPQAYIFFSFCFLEQSLLPKFLIKPFLSPLLSYLKWGYSGSHLISMHTAWKKFVFEVFLVCVFLHLDWIRTEYLSVFNPNAGKYGTEKLRIATLFTQWFKSENFQQVGYFCPLSIAISVIRVSICLTFSLCIFYFVIYFL